MKQYTLFALDYTDEGALERRMQAREEHLQGARSLKEQGNLIFAGAILDESGKMVGSNLILQFAGDEELEEWKGQEPYILKKVWEKVDIRPFKVAQL
ncbi:MAG TPA: YciI family protein [Sphingobacteriaceae bacterium]